MLQAQSYANEIAANYSPAFVTFMAHVLARVWNRLYDGVEFQHVETLQQVAPGQRDHLCALPSQPHGLPAALVCHLSARLCDSAHRGRLNLNLPVVGRLLRKGGAFFLRRTFRGNTLYTVVFMKYLAAMMARGHSIEYFIEGRPQPHRPAAARR